MEKDDSQTAIRPATEKDLPSVLYLFSHLGMDDGSVLCLDRAKSIFERMKGYPDYALYVALIRDRIVGAFALLIMDNLGHKGAPSGVIEDVVVHPEWRGKDVGKTMMEKAMSLCAAKGCYKLALTTNRNRHGAHLFYETLGFDLHGFSYNVPLGTDTVSAIVESGVKS